METRVEVKNNQTEVKSVDERIKNRFSQSRTDRMMEYVTGLRLNNPELFSRLGEDQIKIRVKYGLPNCDYEFTNSGEYERYLRNLLTVNEVEIRSKSDCGRFFEESPFVEAVCFDSNKSIGVGIDRTNRNKYLRGIVSLEHETIHSLQNEYYPSMPIEVMEYEAYVVNWNVGYLRKHSNDLEFIFGLSMGRSVNYWYKEVNEKWGDKIVPVWDKPEYFLKNVDGVSEEAIQNYKTENQIDIKK